MAFSTLNSIALRALPKKMWDQLDPHLQACLFPTNLAFAVSNLKRMLLDRRRTRMASFLQMLDMQQRDTLAPAGTIVLGVASAWRMAQYGDHIVVMVGGWRHGYAHHGVVVERDATGSIQVADFSSPTGNKKMRDAKLRIYSLEEFLRGYATFGIVPYTADGLADESAHRDRSATIAKLLVQMPVAELHTYNVFRWNCECFAIFCKTGGDQWHSDQVLQIMKAIEADLRKGEESFLFGVVTQSSRSCTIS